MRTIRIIGLTADRGTATALVTRLGHRPDARLVVLDDRGPGDGRVVSTIEIEGWHRTPTRSRATTADHLHWAKPTIDGLEPGTRYRLRVVDETRNEIAEAVITTAPANDDRHLRFLAGSCFDVQGTHTQVLDAAYDELAAGGDGVPTYNIWLGDQVYVDAPWLETATTAMSRSIIFDRYLKTWGLSDEAPHNLHRSMARTSNWYLPDDHEFWNGYPNPSWLTLFGHTLWRSVRQGFRLFAKARPHPAAQGPWGEAAGEAFSLFASTLDFESFGEDHSPEQLQTFGTDDAVLVLVDTRWHRTIRKQGPGAGFMHRDDHERLIDLLRSEDRLVCLGLSKPIVGHLPHRGATRRKVEYGPEDYPAQYRALWQALSARRELGRPTIVIAGDVHHHAIRAADDDGLLEIVSSPLAMLNELDEDANLTKLQTRWKRLRPHLEGAWRSAKGWIRGREEALRPRLATTDDSTAYPVFDPDGDWEVGEGRVVFEVDKRDFGDGPDGIEPSGLAAIDIRSDATGHTVTVSYVLGYPGERGQPVNRREDRVLRWDRVDASDPTARPAWHKV